MINTTEKQVAPCEVVTTTYINVCVNGMNAKPVAYKHFEWSTMTREVLYKHSTFNIYHLLSEV